MCLRLLRKTASSILKMPYSTVQRGALYSDSFRLFIKDPLGRLVSPFHDIPLYQDQEGTILNMVVEIPRWTNAKMEIDLHEQLNPIRQDIKHGKPRFVANCFPYKGYIWNYGFLPQTWEDPSHVDKDTNCNGDGDPIDACEIGSKVHERGAVIQVKVLGLVALIDQGETDWKVLVIDVNDPMAEKIRELDDIREFMPGLLESTFSWFKQYKIPDGKPANAFAFNEKPKDRDFAMRIIDDTHLQWERMMSSSKVPDLCRICSVYNAGNTSLKIENVEQLEDIINEFQEKADDHSIDAKIDKLHYVT